MKANRHGNPDEQARANAGWINATTRRARVRDGSMPIRRACVNCRHWTGAAIDRRFICPVIECTTHATAVCERFDYPE